MAHSNYSSGALNAYSNAAQSFTNTSHSSRNPAAAPTSLSNSSSHRPPALAPPYHHVRDKLDISPENKQTRKNLLRDAYFPDWRDDASNSDLNPDEMQKKDPLGTQIWKLYSKTKTQLPNQQRMENLTWRMMAMNLKRKEQEQARYAVTLETPLTLEGPTKLTESELSERTNIPPALRQVLQSFGSRRTIRPRPRILMP